VFGAPVVVSTIIVAVHMQVPCRSVTSSQCRLTAIFCRAGNQLPSIESPTMATVSTGFFVSPNRQIFSVVAELASRQLSSQYVGMSSAAAWTGGRTGSAATPAAVTEARAAAPG